MKLDILTAISPIDGRYRGKTESLANYFSEYALMKYRVFVEIEYFIALCEVPLPALSGIDKTIFVQLQRIYQEFSVEDAQKIKEIGLDVIDAGTPIIPVMLYDEHKAVEMAIQKLAGQEVSDVGIAGVWYNAENIDEQKDKNIFYMG